MTIHHGISFSDRGFALQFYREIKNNEFVMENNILLIPLSLRALLLIKHEEFDKKLIEFTVGYSRVNGYETWAIAIVHPRDTFSRKVGYNIVRGRIEKALGLRYKKYDSLPTTICEKKCRS